MFAVCLLSAADFHSPAGERYAQVTSAGSVLPGGRFLKAFGTEIATGPGPFGLAVSEKGIATTANVGYERFGITIIDPPGQKNGKRARYGLEHLIVRRRKSPTPMGQASPRNRLRFREDDLGIGGERPRPASGIAAGDRRKVVKSMVPSGTPVTGRSDYDSVHRLLEWSTPE